MKRHLFLILILFSYPLFAEPWQNEYAAEADFSRGPFPSLCGLPSFNIDGFYIDISKTNYRSDKFENQTLKYEELDFSFTYLYPFNALNGMTLGAGYIGSFLNWPENPFFEENHFNYVTFSAAALTQCVDRWLWKAGMILFLDTAELSLSQYALYQGFLFGKYSLCQPIMLNGGFILELGLNKGKIWPVLGIDFYPSERFNIHAVFPLDVSVEYFLLKGVSVEGSFRFLRNRHRVKNSDPLPMGIFEYQTTGAEFDINIIPSQHCLITGFIGSTFNGDLKITDRNNHNATHAKFRGSLYSGISANINY